MIKGAFANGLTSTSAAKGKTAPQWSFVVPNTTDTSPVFSRGSGTNTYTRAATQSVLDFESVARTIPANTASFPGLRVVNNQILDSENLLGANWTLGGTASKSGNTLLMPALNDKVYQTPVIVGQNGGACWFRNKLSGTGTISYLVQSNSQTFYIQFALSITPQWYSCKIPTASGDTTVQCSIIRAAANTDTCTAVTLYASSFIDVSGSPSHQGSDDYFATTSAAITKFFDYRKVASLPTFVMIGDSFVAQTGFERTVSNQLEFSYVTNKGTGGNTLTQIQSRFAADVVALAPSCVIIEGGINDVMLAGSDPLATMQSNIQAMASAAIGAGIRPTFCNAPPFGANAGWNASRQSWLVAYNSWLYGYCMSNGYTHFDIYSTLKDPSTVNLLAAYDSGDGLHPNLAGYTVIGRIVAAQLGVTTSNVPITTGKGLFSDPAQPATDSYQTSGNLPASGIRHISIQWTPLVVTGTQYLWSSGTATDHTAILYDGTNIILRKRVSSVNQDAIKVLAAVISTMYQIDAYIYADNSTAVGVNGVLGTTNANTTAIQTAATMELGSSNGASQSNAYFGSFKILTA